MATNYTLMAGYTLTVRAGATKASVQDEAGAVAAFVSPGFAQTFGPYLVQRLFKVSGDATALVEAYTVSLGGMLTSNAGAPDDAVQASVDVNPDGDDNGLTFTANTYGAAGNEISIRYVDPGANNAALSVSVAGPAITVSLATGVAGAITSTAAEVLAAVNAHVSGLVTATLLTSDGGDADDGSGVVTAMASVSLADGAGFGIGLAAPGALCLDTTNGAVYVNTGTVLAPTWDALTGTALYGALSATVNALASLHLYGTGAPVDYTDGDPAATGEGTAPKGALYSDLLNGFVYRNSGTQLEPVWTKLGDAA